MALPSASRMDLAAIVKDLGYVYCPIEVSIQCLQDRCLLTESAKLVYLKALRV